MVCRDAGEDKALKLVTTNSWATSKTEKQGSNIAYTDQRDTNLVPILGTRSEP